MNRNAMICASDWANPQSVVKTMKMRLPNLMILRRPQTSEHGDSTKGPTAYVIMKMDMTRFISEAEVMCRSAAMVSRAGAVMDEERGERNVKADTIRDIYEGALS